MLARPQHNTRVCPELAAEAQRPLTEGPVIEAAGPRQSLHIATSLLPVKRASGSMTSYSTVCAASSTRLSC